MRLKSIHISDFKSIDDTGIVYLPKRNITSLVGQNESGKSTLLDALQAFENRNISSEHRNYFKNGGLPVISCSYSIEESDFKDFPYQGDTSVQLLLKDKIVIVERAWSSFNSEATVSINNESLLKYIENDSLIDEVLGVEVDSQATNNEVAPEVEVVEDKSESNVGESKLSVNETIKKLTEYVEENRPKFVVYNKNTKLPDKIVLDRLIQAEKADDVNVVNYLFSFVTGKNEDSYDYNKLLDNDTTTVRAELENLSRVVSREFNNFWKQYTGKEHEVSIVVERHYLPDKESSSHTCYLLFYIKNNGGALIPPSLRSDGFQWFLNFFIFMNYSSLVEPKPFLLIDEPGSSLHSDALVQTRLFIEKMAKDKDIQIIFSTHNEEMIDPDDPCKNLIFERGLNNDISIVPFIESHTSNEASILPIIKAIGATVRFSDPAIKKNNVLLEEVSGYYYFNSQKKILKYEQDFKFIPGRGASTVSNFYQLMVCLGLEVLALIDHDKAGKDCYEEIQETLYNGDSKHFQGDVLLLGKEGQSVEDLFSTNDFKKHVLPEELHSDYDKFTPKNDNSKNSEFVTMVVKESKGKYSKVRLAQRFYANSEASNWNIEFTNITMDNFRSELDRIVGKLKLE